MKHRRILTLAALLSSSALAQGAPFVFGDARPDAPELAARGTFPVGVRTLTVTNRDQLDVLKVSATNANPRADRPLTLEVWYPARLASGQAQSVVYRDVLGVAGEANRPNTPFEFAGRAARDAAPDASAKFPLVIVSHGYPGSRLMMTALTENLASKGYVVVAIDHTESLFSDRAGFASTLLNRPLDQLFVLGEMARLGTANSGSFLAGIVDANNTAIVGYSMGGYGALNAAGAGFNPQMAAAPFVPGGALNVRALGNDAFAKSVDPRVKAVVAFAPWGGSSALRNIGVNTGAPFGFWDAAGLANLKVPSLFVVGDQDDVSGFTGVRELFENAVNSDRAMIVYANARHNVAPNPAPPSATNFDDYMRYAEPAWDVTRLNNLNQHFLTAFLNLHLKGQADMRGYFDPAAFKGFKPRTSVGVTIRTSAPR